MPNPRRTAVVVTGVAGVLAAAACLAVDGPGPAPTSPAAPAVRVSAGPSAEFVAPLHVPAPTAGVPGPAQAPGGDGLLGPGSVVTPPPAVAPRAVFHPASRPA